MKDWTLLETYPSQTEARVVESFLKAQGLEVELYDQHSAYNLFPARKGQTGMRLMVLKRDLEMAQELVNNAKVGSHLSLIDSQAEGMEVTKLPPFFNRREWIAGALFALLVVILALTVSFY